MIHLRVEITLTLTGPILTQATMAGAFGIDAVMARDRCDRPYLPYSLVRGKLRQALEEIQDALDDKDDRASFQDAITRWFGPRSAETDFNSQRGVLFFSDFVYPHPRPEDQLLSRIKIDQATGAVSERMLMVADSPFKYREPAGFRGEIRCICIDEGQVEKTLQWLGAGFRWLTHLGAARTIGFGRVDSMCIEHIHLTELAVQDGNGFAHVKRTCDQFTSHDDPVSRTHRHPRRLCTAISNFDEANTHYTLRVRPRGLFCIGGPPKLSNVFETEVTIPGAALLGALATMYCVATGSSTTSNEVALRPGSPWQALAGNFAAIRFTHAFPTTRGSNRRPVVAPHSLAVAEPSYKDIPKDLYDVALCARPRLIRHDEEARPPVFASDWKRHVVTEAVEERFGWPKIRKEVRIRTAIDINTLRPEKERLFGYEMVDPEGLDWLATLDLTDVAPPDRPAQVLDDLQQLLSAGLEPLGKTKVNSDTCIGPPDSFQPAVQSDVNPLPGRRWVITLQTPALLCTPHDLRWSPNETPCDKLHAGYHRVFAELSGGRLELERFFAKQTLSSMYFARARPRDERGQYFPFVLTDQGSTFVLRSRGNIDEAQKTIASWLARGISLAESIAKLIDRGFDPGAVEAWKHCPILNRFGFGEIIVNPPWLLNNGPNSSGWPTTLQD